MLLKMNLRVQIDQKLGAKMKIESMIIHLALHLKVNFNIFIYKDAQEGARDVALKGTLLVTLKLHLFFQSSMYKSVQNNSTF